MFIPFKIIRTEAAQAAFSLGVKYLFELIDTRDGRIRAEAYSNSPVAPKAIRDRQATLNTRAVLDGE